MKRWVLVLLSILFVLSSLLPAQAALLTTGAPPTDNNLVYQVGTTGTLYKEATNSYDDAAPGITLAYHFVTQDPSYTDGSTITKTFTINGKTASYSVKVHRLDAYNPALNNAGNPGLGSLISYKSATNDRSNTTWIIDSGTYRDDCDYTAIGTHTNISIVGQDGSAPTLVRAPLKDYGSTYSAYVAKGFGESLLRHTFMAPNIYIQNLIFDGNNREMLPYDPIGTSGGRNRGEYLLSINAPGAGSEGVTNLVMRDITVQNLGASATANFGNKNVALNFYSSNDAPPAALSSAGQKNIERFTVMPSVLTKTGLGFISSNQSNGIYLRDITTHAAAGQVVYPIKIEHAATSNLPDLKLNQMIIDDTLNLHQPLVYIQDVRYNLNTLPASYRYLYYSRVNGYSYFFGSAPAILASDTYTDPASLVGGQYMAIFDRQENVWILDENFAGANTIPVQFESLRRAYFNNLSSTTAGKRPLINIKYVAKDNDIDGFTVPDFRDYPVNITAVTAQTASAEALAPQVPVKANATFDLGPAAYNVKLYNFDFDALARYTMQESVSGVPAQADPDPLRKTDPYNGSYAPADPSCLLNYDQYVPLAAQAAKVTGSSEATFQNCRFTQLADDLLYNGASINRQQLIPLTLTMGQNQALGVTAAAAYTVSPALAQNRVRESNAVNTDTRLYYVSDNPGVVSVAADGTLTPVAQGTATIYVKAIDANNQGEIEKPYATFRVTVKAASVFPTLNVPLTAKKVYKNGTLKGGEFTFELLDNNMKCIATAKNGADGKIVFPDRTFSKAVSYVYHIREVKGSLKKVAYDKTLYKVIITTTPDASGTKLTYKMDVQRDGVPFAGSIAFTNVKQAPATGDNQFNLILALIASSLLLGAAFLTLKRRSER